MPKLLPNALLVLTLLSLGLSLVFSLRDVRRREESGPGIALGANLAALALLLIEFIYVPAMREELALSALGDSVVFFALVLLAVNNIAAKVAQSHIVSLFVTPLAMLLTMMALFFERWFPTGEAQRAVGQSFLVIHIVLFVLSYAMFSVAAAFGAMFLALDGSLKSKSFSPVFFKLPGLARLDSYAGRTALSGLALLTLAIALSLASLAQAKSAVMLGRESIRVASDFTIIATYAIWIYYAVYAICRIQYGWVGRRSSLMAVVGLVLVLGLYVGGLLVPAGTLHSPASPSAVARARAEVAR